MAGENEIIKLFGDTSIKKNFFLKNPVRGFFNECRPGWCYSYIAFIDNKKVNYITDEEGLRKFMGRIDNLEEALLLSKINGLWIDSKEMRASSYKRTVKGFELNLVKSESCPVKYESRRVFIHSNGNFTSESTGVYHEEPDQCIMYY